MGVFKAIFESRYKVVMVYKFAAISGIVTQIFFAFFKIFTLYTFSSGSSNAPFQDETVITYIWLTQIFLSIIPWNVNGEEMNSIRTGSIAYEMVRPSNLFSMIYSKTLAWRVSSSIVRIIPMLIFNIFILRIFNLNMFTIRASSIESVFLFIISIIISYFLSTMITVFLYSIALYTIDATNFIGLISSFAMLLSGTIIPLAYFPEFMQKWLEIQPFKGIIDTPALILTGQYTYLDSYKFIALQLMWVVVFYYLNKIMFNKGTKKIVVQGG